jgi:hypothetical protein
MMAAQVMVPNGLYDPKGEVIAPVSGKSGTKPHKSRIEAESQCSAKPEAQPLYGEING